MVLWGAETSRISGLSICRGLLVSTAKFIMGCSGF